MILTCCSFLCITWHQHKLKLSLQRKDKILLVASLCIRKNEAKLTEDNILNRKIFKKNSNENVQNRRTNALHSDAKYLTHGRSAIFAH